jgi:hypothetical protein
MGVNKYRYMKGKSTFECSTHAEIDLLSKLGPKAKGSKIFVYRFNNTCHPKAREAKNAKPCPLCQHELKKSGVARVFYIDNHDQVRTLKNRDMLEVVGSPHVITRQFFEQNNNTTSFKVLNYIRR